MYSLIDGEANSDNGSFGGYGGWGSGSSGGYNGQLWLFESDDEESDNEDSDSDTQVVVAESSEKYLEPLVPCEILNLPQ